MTVFRYPVRSLIGDYVRAGVGIAVAFGVLASVPPSPAIVLIFGGLGLIFTVFGARTVERHVTSIAIDDEEIRRSALGTRVLPWKTLKRLKLRYYGTRRQRTREDSGGFMQLTLSGQGSSMTLESSLDGFELIAWRAAKAARENGVSLDPTSAGNLLDIGIDADADQPPPRPSHGRR